MILNVEKRPNAIDDIISNKTNLFKLAKDSGYTTHWISAQSNDGFSYIRSYIGLKNIDLYIDSTHYGYSKYDNAYDSVLEKEIKKIDFTKRNFIVLNMIGSHSPYELRVPKSFHPFNNEGTLSNYNNTVAYTDKIISNILKEIKQKAGKVLFVFTSDHGQSVQKNSYGHGNINNPLHYQVPLIIYTHNFKLNSNIKKLLSDEEYTSHNNMSLMVSYYLGYDTLKYMDTNITYINGNQLSGNGGYLQYNFHTRKTKLEQN
jgi:glucan phosphoethanolaminetransferase (alkaline phosphatase superfamily)